MKKHYMEKNITNSRLQVEQKIIHWLESLPPGEIKKASRYSVLSGGHRWRAMFVIGIWNLFESTPDIFDSVLSGAASIEIIHAASLILDDLPSMDNAFMRRGKPCTHLVYPKWVVDLLPVFLVTGAYNLFLGNKRHIHPERHLKAIQLLSHTGLQMVNGQEKDVTQSEIYETSDDLIECYRLKTGALWSSAGKAVAILCGAEENASNLMAKCGMDLAIYYQFLDDVGDVEGTVELIGKTGGLDKDKCTAVTMFGVDGTIVRARQFQDKALSHLDGYNKEADFLRYLIKRASYVLE